MKEGIIYLITNTVNGKKYVGKTVQTIQSRWRTHKYSAQLNKPYAISQAIRKYGPEVFTIVVIAESLEPFLDTLEQFFIKLYCSRTFHHGYNMTEGGEGQSGTVRTPEQKAALSARMMGNKNGTGKKRTPEQNAAQSARMKGIKRTPEQNAAHSARIMGNKNGAGKKRTPEQNAANSDAQKKAWASRKKSETLSLFLPAHQVSL